MKSMSLGFWIAAGGRYETTQKAGMYHFIEHLLFDGTKRYSSIKIKETIEGVGGSLNGFTGEEFTCFLVKMVGKFFDLGFDVLSDMVLNPRLNLKDIVKEKAIITEEIKMYNDLPDHYAAELLNQLLWPRHPLGMNLAGTVESVNSITKKDVVSYLRKSYAPSNIVIAAAGAIKHEELVGLAKKRFLKLTKSKKLHFKPCRSNLGKIKNKLHFRKIEQTHIALGTRSLSAFDPDRFAVSLLHIVLGANMSSRLFQEVRERRGLAYAISSHVKKYRDTGAFFITAGVKNEKMTEAVELILKELISLKQKGITASELKRAKEYYIGQLSLALEDTAEHMVWIGEQMVCLERVLSPGDILKKVNAVTREDVLRMANRLFKKENFNLALVGPFNEKQKTKIKKIIGDS